jgi:hypothetical protein
MKVLTCIRDNLQLVPHFVQHYRALGVDEFWIGVHRGSFIAADLMRRLDGVRCRIGWIEGPVFGGQVDADFRNRFRHDLPPDEWIVVADLDEFVTIEGVANLPDYLSGVQADSLWGWLRDRVAVEGIIPSTIHADRPISDQFPWACRLTEMVVRGIPSKRCLARAGVPIIAGHHAGNANVPVTDQPHPGLVVDHYRWCGPFRYSLKARIENRPQSPEYRNLRTYLDRHRWRINLLDDALQPALVGWANKP